MEANPDEVEANPDTWEVVSPVTRAAWDPVAETLEAYRDQFTPAQAAKLHPEVVIQSGPWGQVVLQEVRGVLRRELTPRITQATAPHQTL